MNRICFVSKKEEAQRLGLNARNVREWLTPQAKFFKQQFRAFFKAYHNFFETNMHLFCWNRLLFTGYSVLITNLDLLKLCGDGNPEMLQFLNIWVSCALKFFYVYETKSLLLYSIEWLSWIANCTMSNVLVISESSHRVLFVSQR